MSRLAKIIDFVNFLTSMKICYKCGKTQDISGTVSRGDTCPGCGAYLRCCLNCNFHDPGRHNQCREPHSEYVADREGVNFCDWFSFADRAAGTKASSSEDAREKFDALFKKRDTL